MSYNKLNTTKNDKIAYYVRVSGFDQESSIDNQIEYAKEYMSDNNIKNYEIFVDESLTGTDTRKRKAFNDMVKRCKEKEFSVMIAKSITRYGRNQRQCLQVLSELVEVGCRCIFLEDNIDSSKDMTMIGLLLWIGENEARSSSKRISYIYKEHFNKIGKIHNCIEPYGYNYDIANKTFIVNEEERNIVIDIFNMYLHDGYGCTKIAKYLQDNNIPTKQGGKWANNTIRTILKNPIYIGTLVQNKSEGIDVTIKKRNKLKKDKWIYHEDKFEAIIDKDTFNKVQIVTNIIF